MSNAIRAHSGGLLRAGAALAVAAALMALPVGGGEAYGFQQTAAGYVCMDMEETSPNAPTMQWENVATATGITFDDQALNFPIPFPFTFMGVPQTTTNVCSNGWINFGATATTYFNQAIPNAGIPNNAIFGFWDDLYLPSGGNISYGTVGAAPTRRFVVTWNNVPHISGAGYGQFTFQILLYEAGNAIKLQYQTMTGTVSNAQDATIGVEDAAGTQANQYVFGNGVNLTNPANNTYNGLAVAFWPTGTTPPWAVVEPTPPPGGGGGNTGPAPGAVDVDDDEESRTHEFCGGAAGGSVALFGLALALGVAASLVRRGA